MSLKLFPKSGRIGLLNYHLGGSCRMGSTNRSDTIVDERLRVKGIKNLRVIDSSVMSDMVNANTQAVSMIIGKKGTHIRHTFLKRITDTYFIQTTITSINITFDSVLNSNKNI